MESNEDIVAFYLKNKSVLELSVQLRKFKLLINFEEFNYTERVALNYIDREHFEMKTYTFQDFIDAVSNAKKGVI